MNRLERIRQMFLRPQLATPSQIKLDGKYLCLRLELAEVVMHESESFLHSGPPLNPKNYQAALDAIYNYDQFVNDQEKEE